MLLIPLKWSDNFQCLTFPSMPLRMPVWMRKLFMFVKGNWKRPRRIWPKLKAKFRSCRLCSGDWLVSLDSTNFNTSLNIESQSFQVCGLCIWNTAAISKRRSINFKISNFILGCITRLFLVYRFKHIPINTQCFSQIIWPLCVWHCPRLLSDRKENKEIQQSLLVHCKVCATTVLSTGCTI